MKWPLQLSLALYSLILAVASFLTVLYVIGFQQPAAQLFSYAFQDTSSRWITGIIGVGILFLSLFTFVKSLKTDRGTKKMENVFVKDNKLGQVSVSIDALENVVVKAARQVEGIREVTPSIKDTSEGAAIYLKTQVAPSVSIPLISEELQNKVKERVKEFAGVDAVEIRVFIENVAQEVRAGR